MSTTIASIQGIQIFDSRAIPTVLATVTLKDGSVGQAAAPSGASTGSFEAFELRDGQPAYLGKGVSVAVTHVNDQIGAALSGQRADDETKIDDILLRLDDTPQKTSLGANAMLAVSLACAKAAAMHYRLPLWRYIGGTMACELPMPMLNVLNGGAHADNNVEIQEFMIVPVGAYSFFHAMQMGTEIYGHLKAALKARGLSTAVGDEGGYAPNLEDDEQALALLCEAIDRAGYVAGKDVAIALDVAATEWAGEQGYHLSKRGQEFTPNELLAYYQTLSSRYPIVSIEDPFSEDDFSAFAKMTALMGEQVQVVGDDLFVTNPTRLMMGIDSRAANAILVKPNQIGTLSETLATIRLAKRNGMRTILSHRSGETEDTTIADLAVGTNAGQIKTGAPARSERVSKYNRLLLIERELGQAARFTSPLGKH